MSRFADADDDAGGSGGGGAAEDGVGVVVVEVGESPVGMTPPFGRKAPKPFCKADKLVGRESGERWRFLGWMFKEKKQKTER